MHGVKPYKKKKIILKEVILEQNLYGNHSLISNGLPIFFQHWAKSNFKKVKDIWDEQNLKFITSNQVLTQLTKKTNWMVEFEILKKSIPKEMSQKTKL